MKACTGCERLAQAVEKVAPSVEDRRFDMLRELHPGPEAHSDLPPTYQFTCNYGFANLHVQAGILFTSTSGTAGMYLGG